MDIIKAVIIDDEPSVVELLSDLIKDHFDDVTIIGTSETIKKAAKIISDLRPDIVFLDINIPRGSGMELLDLFPTRNFDVVFITGYPGLEPLVQDYMPLGFICKPAGVDDLSSIFKKYRYLKTDNTANIIRKKTLF
nr:response regulator [Bacteroidota bacterium]